MDAGGIEDESLGFAFGAVGGDLLAVPEETDSGSVADSDDDLAASADGSVGGGDESFAGHGLPVGGDGDPRAFGSADHELEGGG